MPLAAFGDSRAIMEHLAPLGGVYQAGTCRATRSPRPAAWPRCADQSRLGDALSARTRSLVDGLQAAATAEGCRSAATARAACSAFLLPELPQNYAQVLKTDSARFNQLFHGLLDQYILHRPCMKGRAS